MVKQRLSAKTGRQRLFQQAKGAAEPPLRGADRQRGAV